MKQMIAVALSGGIDSLIAAKLLIQQGHSVVGIRYSAG
jgi:tRNA U34 2-thiouridine synthase MnmA/TrmU